MSGRARIGAYNAPVDPSDRILDANFNRAREALRVMEDYVRFVLDDARLAQDAKALRHNLADILRTLGTSDLIAARDTHGDVGRTLGTAQEYTRASLEEVAVAAGKRLTEALRVLEEVGKTHNRPFGGEMERLRYQAYDLEKRLVLRLAPASRFHGVSLYVLLTESFCRSDWLETAEAALRGGADALQLREKELPDNELLARARRLSGLCHDYEALFVVNDRPDIAALADADGVHVGQDDLPVQSVRRILPPGRIVGVSTHDLDQVRRAAAAVPDYIAVGPMFPSLTKAIRDVPGPALWREASQETAIPLAAIGGVSPESLPELVGLGCRRICVCQAVIGEPDVEAAARRLKRELRVPVPAQLARS